jgi:hypothetical protein
MLLCDAWFDVTTASRATATVVSIGPAARVGAARRCRARPGRHPAIRPPPRPAGPDTPATGHAEPPQLGKEPTQLGKDWPRYA